MVAPTAVTALVSFSVPTALPGYHPTQQQHHLVRSRTAKFGGDPYCFRQESEKANLGGEHAVGYGVGVGVDRVDR